MEDLKPCQPGNLFGVIVQGAVRLGDVGRAAISLLRNWSSGLLITRV
jgi:hypothetical protein